MSKISVLPDVLANMIAAGEVVNRPANIIKELVENAVDANARGITVMIEDGGIKKIVVLDNGCGMDKNDLLLATTRHATSKIKTRNDLFKITTLGFRGEALPSIAAVSNMVIISKTSNSCGYELVLSQGKVQKLDLIAANDGTKVEVTDLFFNTPARFKYLHSIETEKNVSIDVFNALALANPGINFKLYVNQKLHYNIPNLSTVNTITDIYGYNVVKNIINIRKTFGDFSIDCYIGNLNYTTAKNNRIFLFFNRRYIKNQQLTNAIIDGLNGFIPINRFPYAFCYFEIDPKLIDVNVHPQKTTIRLANELLLAFYLKSLIKEYLAPKKVINDETAKVCLITDQKMTSLVKNEVIEINELTLSHSEISNPFLSSLSYIGILAGTYLLYQNNDGLWLLDFHAAYERLEYERLLLLSKTLIIVHLLVPIDFSLSKDQKEYFQKKKIKFEELGFNFLDLSITAIPSYLKTDNVLDFFYDYLEDTTYNDDILDKKIKKIACTNVLKGNTHLHYDVSIYLLKELDKASNTLTCPHGRPLFINVSLKEIEKMFKRVI